MENLIMLLSKLQYTFKNIFSALKNSSSLSRSVTASPVSSLSWGDSRLYKHWYLRDRFARLQYFKIIVTSVSYLMFTVEYNDSYNSLNCWEGEFVCLVLVVPQEILIQYWSRCEDDSLQSSQCCVIQETNSVPANTREGGRH